MSSLQTHQQNHPMDECCDICGNIGYQEFIIQCTKCQINQEHGYCMRTFSVQPPENWMCEECTQKNGKFTEASKLISHVEPHKDLQCAYPRKVRSARGCINWEKKVVKGRTKYLPVEEALQLPKKKNCHSLKITNHSNPMSPKKHISHLNPMSPKKHISHSNPLSPKKHIPYPLPRTPVKSGVRIPKFQQPEKHLKTRGLENYHDYEVVQLKAQSSKVLKGPVENEQALETNKNIGDTEITQTKHILVAPASCPQIISGGDGCASMELGTSNANELAFSTNIKKCFSDPVTFPSWKGSFNIYDNLNFKGFQGYHPFRVRRKVCEFSKMLPENLDFKLVPRRNLWGNLFDDYWPTREDVGLYFFPSDRERSQEYMILLELIRNQDVIMRMQIDNVEVLVLTSAVLQEDCQKVEGEYFLWALFHRIGKKDTGVNMGFVDSIDSKGGKDNNAEVDMEIDNLGDNEELDMEVDMIGGQDVGKLDVIIPSISKTLDNGTQCGLLNVQKPPFQDIPPGFKPSPALQKPSFQDIPPGFKPPLALQKPSFQDIPPSFKPSSALQKPPFDDVPPGFKPSLALQKPPFDDVPPGFKPL